MSELSGILRRVGKPTYVAPKYARVGPWVLRNGALYHEQPHTGYCEVPLDKCREGDKEACYEEMARIADKSWATQEDLDFLAAAFNHVLFGDHEYIQAADFFTLRLRLWSALDP